MPAAASPLRLPALLVAAVLALWLWSEEATASGVDNAWELPPIVLPDLTGEVRDLRDWRGRVILLNFWAPWCKPCRVEVPHLVQWQTEYGTRGLQVVSVGFDEERRLTNFARTLGITYPVLVAQPEQSRRLLPTWGDPGQLLPHSVVIGRDGHLHYIRQGIMDAEAFRVHVLPLLQDEEAVAVGAAGGQDADR
jgi:thiol-disulfide isomerase/thioredoxin